MRKCHLKECNKLTNTKFCSSTCAAIFNNQKFIKRPRNKKCKACANLITSNYTYCRECIKLDKHLSGRRVDNARTISSIIRNKNDANKYTQIRQHAKKITKNREQQCMICKYDKHVETCHIKSIINFSLDATLGEVNHPNNLVLLCPNHHWELDHGLLKL